MTNMDLEKYKTNSFYVYEGHGLASELNLLDAISLYQEGKFLKEEQVPVFREFIETILSEKPDLNQYPAYEIGRMFKVRKYEQKETIKNLAYYEIGKIWSKEAMKHTLNDFAFISENMESGFYIGYQPDYDAIRKIIGEIDGRDENFLKKCRSMHIERDKIGEYMRCEFSDELSDDDTISRINLYNDGAYTELPLGVGTLGWFLLRDNHLDLYAELLDRLYYPPLRGVLIYETNRLVQCIQLWDILKKSNSSRRKVLGYQLREQMLRLLSKETETLENNKNNENLPEDYRQTASSLFDKWHEQRSQMASECVPRWIDCFGITEVSGWYGRHKAFTDSKNPKYVTHEIDALGLIENILTNYVALDSDKFADSDIKTLLYYARVAVIRKASKDICAELMKNICKHVYSDKYVWPFKLDETSFSTVRDLYHCLLMSGCDGMRMMFEFRCPTEGYGIDHQAAYRAHVGDAFWFPVLVLLTEETKDIGYFEHLTDVMINFADFERNPTNDSYFVAFYMCQLVVSQILTEIKDKFESQLIYCVPNLHFVLRVLSANDGKMSDEIINMLHNRVEKEWGIEKELIKQQYKEQTHFLDEYLHKANVL